MFTPSIVKPLCSIAKSQFQIKYQIIETSKYSLSLVMPHGTATVGKWDTVTQVSSCVFRIVSLAVFLVRSSWRPKVTL